MQLLEIKFNHNPRSSSGDAYNIRRNETTPVVVPEWQHGPSKSPEDSVAAYSLANTRGKLLTIQARFRIDETDAREVSIRAIEENPEGSVGNVLGAVAEEKVGFENRESAFTSFSLPNARIWSAGVGIHDVFWAWQYRVDDSSSWVTFDHSSHRIYTTLSLPGKPWVQQPFDPSNTHLVWTDVLEQACKWGRDIVTNKDKAAAAVVQEVFALGPQVIQFDYQNNGSSSYSDPYFFDCTAFLLRLSGQDGNGLFVNCSDCASIVSTFANALGASLSQARMGPPPGALGFPLKPHLRIGMSKEIPESSFRFHEVAWKGDCEEDDDVFDACLLVNGSNRPQIFFGKSASNLRFGLLGQRHYRFRLVKDGSEPNCLPIKGSAVRRRLGPVPQVLRNQPVPEALVLHPSRPNHFVRRFSLRGLTPAGFAQQSIRAMGLEGDVPVIRSFWTEQDNGQSLVRVDSYECSSLDAAATGVSNLLDDFELPGMTRVENADQRVLEFGNAENSTALFAVANLVFLIRNVGAVTTRLAPLLTSIKEYVLQPIMNESSIAESATSRFVIEPEGVVGGRVELELTSNDSDGPYWFFSDLGEVLREGNKLVYQPAESGEHTIHIWRTEAGRVSTTRLKLRVNESANGN